MTELEIDTDTFVDEDGDYGEPGTEYVFHPESTPNGEPKRKQPDRILRTPTDDENTGSGDSEQSLQDQMEELIESKDCKETEEREENQERGSGGDESLFENESESGDDDVMFGDGTDTDHESGTDDDESEFIMKDGEVV
jgi:hypothetical protein